jgi:DNA-binding transcriptional LysR family regulator
MLRMRYTHIRNVDLNLLVAFQALMEERSITGAARRMFLSQPAMSRIVDRLQEVFEDELLVRTPNGYEPTHRALTAYAELEQVLPRVDALLRGTEFDPSEETEVFRLSASDYGTGAIVPSLMTKLGSQAPKVTIEVVPGHTRFERLDRNEVDLILSDDTELAEWTSKASQALRTEPLCDCELVCLVRQGHPATKRPLTLRRYLKERHVELGWGETLAPGGLSFVGEQQTVVARALDPLGERRDVRVRIPYPLAVGVILEGTDLVATLPSIVAARLAVRTKTVAIRAPAELRKHRFSFNQIWHPRNETNPLHKWLRGLIRQIASERWPANSSPASAQNSEIPA